MGLAMNQSFLQSQYEKLTSSLYSLKNTIRPLLHSVIPWMGVLVLVNGYFLVGIANMEKV